MKHALIERKRPDLHRLGSSDLAVSPLAISCRVFAGDASWGEQTERDPILIQLNLSVTRS